MERKELSKSLYGAFAKAIYLAAALYVLLTFIDAIRVILLFFLLAAIFAIAFTPPVNWLESRRIPRPIGTILIVGGTLGVFIGVGFLVAPRITDQLNQLGADIPRYIQSLSRRVMDVAGNVPGLQEQIKNPDHLSTVLPSAGALLGRIGSYSVTLLTIVFGFVVLISLIAYMVASPRPLLRGIVGAVPVKFRDSFAEAYKKGSDAVVNWVWANVIIGALEGVAASIFLTLIGVPGALVWGIVTFFAELIPQIGGYLMALPPLIVALAIDPMLALYVVLFYIVMQQVVNNLVAPPIRAKSMKIHPVSEIFAVLALAFAFGPLGALISDPVVGFVKAFYDSFYKPLQPDDDRIDDRVEDMLHRRSSASDGVPDVYVS